jgi:hypothetical protein
MVRKRTKKQKRWYNWGGGLLHIRYPIVIRPNWKGDIPTHQVPHIAQTMVVCTMSATVAAAKPDARDACAESVLNNTEAARHVPHCEGEHDTTDSVHAGYIQETFTK